MATQRLARQNNNYDTHVYAFSTACPSRECRDYLMKYESDEVIINLSIRSIAKIK